MSREIGGGWDPSGAVFFHYLGTGSQAVGLLDFPLAGCSQGPGDAFLRPSFCGDLRCSDLKLVRPSWGLVAADFRKLVGHWEHLSRYRMRTVFSC